MNRTRLTQRAGCRGITLVEFLVSMLIGLFIVSGVVKVMVDSKDNFLLEEQLSYIQDNARFALDQITRDIRMAGYFGCSTNGELTNSLNGSTDNDGWMFSSNGIKGFEYSQVDNTIFSENLVNSITQGTDVVIVNRGEPDDSLRVSGHVPSSATIDLTQPSNLVKGQILVIAAPNCSNMAIFQMSGPNNTANPSQIVHNSGGSTSPGNCHKSLTDGYDCTEPPASNIHGDKYPPGSSVMQFSSNAYFIGTSNITGLPSLYRHTLTVSNEDAVTTSQELVSGVENLQIIYGVDNDEEPDGTIDRYYTADAITQNVADEVSNYVGWDRVMVARVTLILRSSREVFPENTDVNLGEGYTYDDRYMRQKVSTTVRIRNRGLSVDIPEGEGEEEVPVEGEDGEVGGDVG